MTLRAICAHASPAYTESIIDCIAKVPSVADFAARQNADPGAQRRSTRVERGRAPEREAEPARPHFEPTPIARLSTSIGNTAMRSLLHRQTTSTALKAAHTGAHNAPSDEAGSTGELEVIQRQEAGESTGADTTAATGDAAGSSTTTSSDLVSPRNRQLAAEQFELGNQAYLNGDFSTAARAFTRIIEQSGADPQTVSEMWFNVAQCQYRLGRHAAALNAYQQIGSDALSERRSVITERMAACRQRLGVATNASGEVVPLTGEESADRFERGSAAYSAGDYETALRLFTQILEGSTLTPHDRAAMLHNAGMCNYRMRRFAAAIPLFEQALAEPALNNTEAAQRYLTESRNEIGIATNDSGGALTFLQQERRERFDRASAAYGSGDYSTALRIFTQMIEQDEFDSESQAQIRWNMAMCNYRMNRYATALYLFLQIQNESSIRGDELRSHVADCRAHLNIATDANGDLIPLSIDESASLFEQGNTAYTNGDYIAAARHFTRIYDAGGLDATSRAQMAFNIGQCQYRLGRYAAAIPYYQEALTDSAIARAPVAQERLDDCRRRINATPAPARNATGVED